MLDIFSKWENKCKYLFFWKRRNDSNIALPFTRVFQSEFDKMKANRQSCQLDGSRSRRGGTSLNETGGM